MEKKIEEKGGKKEEEVGDFFFQAEDGIRDRDVTGVQTCALPICPWEWKNSNDCDGYCSNP